MAEHLVILARENNRERKMFYMLAWYLGASQSDLAFLNAEDVDWERNVISYERLKTGAVAIMRLDEAMKEILKDLPALARCFLTCAASVPATGRRSLSNVATDLVSKAFRCIVIGMLGRNAPRRRVIPNGMPR